MPQQNLCLDFKVKKIKNKFKFPTNKLQQKMQTIASVLLKKLVMKIMPRIRHYEYPVLPERVRTSLLP